MEKPEKGFSFFRNAKKIVNLRFAELNQLEGDKKFPLEKMTNKLYNWGKQPSWQVLVFGLVIIGGLSLAQFLWPSTPNQVIVTPKTNQEETIRPTLLNEPKNLPEGSPTTPAGVPIEIYPAPQQLAELDDEAIPVMAAALDWTKAVKPISGQIGVGFGFDYAEFFEDYRLHGGIDYTAQKGAPVVAVLVGTIKAIYDDELYGKTVKIEHGDDWYSLYAQLGEVTVKEGQKVATGEKIGSLGSPSIAEANRGTHLHFELIHLGEPIDPALYLGK